MAPPPGQLPALPTDTGTPAATAAAAPAALPASAGDADQPTVRVVTDVLDMDVSLQGGTLVRADLLQYPQAKTKDSPPVRLLTTAEGGYEVARSGLRATGGGGEPTHLATFCRRPAQEFRLAPGAEELRVPLTWSDGQGIVVTKTYTFKRGSYEIGLTYDVTNGSPAEWKAASYVQFVRHMYTQKRSMFDVESYAYRGPAIYNGQKFSKLDVNDEEDAQFSAGVRRRLDGGDAASLRDCCRAAGGGDVRLHAWHSRARIPCSDSADR